MINESEEVVVLLMEIEPDKRLSLVHYKRMKPITNIKDLSTIEQMEQF